MSASLLLSISPEASEGEHGGQLPASAPLQAEDPSIMAENEKIRASSEKLASLLTEVQKSKASLDKAKTDEAKAKCQQAFDLATYNHASAVTVHTMLCRTISADRTRRAFIQASFQAEAEASKARDEARAKREAEKLARDEARAKAKADKEAGRTSQTLQARTGIDDDTIREDILSRATHKPQSEETTTRNLVQAYITRGGKDAIAFRMQVGKVFHQLKLEVKIVSFRGRSGGFVKAIEV